MEENAFIHYMKEVPMASLQEFLNAFDEAQKKYASYGITTVQEGMTVREILPFYQALTRQRILDLDVVLYRDLAAREEMLRRWNPIGRGGMGKPIMSVWAMENFS